MQSLLNKKEIIIQKEPEKSQLEPLKKSDIEKFYAPQNENMIGLEFERLSLDKNTFLNASYEKVSKIIENLAKILKWDLIYDNETIIGAKNQMGDSLSLEPGLQFEISLKPSKNILDIDLKLSKIVELSNKIAKAYDVTFLNYGISPVDDVDKIEILNKRRYKIMNKYLPNCEKSELCPVMMKKTAGIQINLDFKDSIDCYNKLKFYNLIMPFMMALCANSPFDNNNLTNYQSSRARAWLFTGANRCNIFYKNIFSKLNKEKNVIKNYIEEILKVPLIYIERNNKIIEIEGKIDFNTFLKEGYQGYFATMEDYILHQSLIFPDIRLKNYIEIRNHDSQNPAFALALCAFYKGLNQNIKVLLEEFDFLNIKDIDKINKEIIEKGLDIEIKGKKGWDIIKSLYLNSIKNLSAKDRIYLAPIKNLIELRKTNADFIKKYEIDNVNDLVDFLE